MGCNSTKSSHSGLHQSPNEQALEMAQERDMQQRMAWGGRPTPSRQRAIQERIRELDAITRNPSEPSAQPATNEPVLVEEDVDIHQGSLDEGCLDPPVVEQHHNPLFTLRGPPEQLHGVSSDMECHSHSSSFD